MRGILFLVCLGRSEGWKDASFRRRSRRGQRSWAKGSLGGPSWLLGPELFCDSRGEVSEMEVTFGGVNSLVATERTIMGVYV